GGKTEVAGTLNGRDPLGIRQARAEKPDPAGPDARGLRPDSHGSGLGRGLPQRGRRDRGGLRGPRSEETRLSGTRRGRAEENDPGIEHLGIADYDNGTSGDTS